MEKHTPKKKSKWRKYLFKKSIGQKPSPEKNKVVKKTRSNSIKRFDIKQIF